MYKRYLELRDLAGVKDAEVARAIGIAQSTFTDWKNGRSQPKNEKLKKIADFFGVSLNYFTESEQEHTPTQNALSADEQELLSLFRSLSPMGQIAALNTLRGFQTIPEYVQKNTGMEVG